MNKLTNWSEDRNFKTTLGESSIPNTTRMLIDTRGDIKISVVRYDNIDPLLGNIGTFEIFTYDKLFKDIRRFDTIDQVIDFLNSALDSKKCETCGNAMQEHDFPDKYTECVDCTWDEETRTMQKELYELLKLKEETDDQIKHLKNQLEDRD